MKFQFSFLILVFVFYFQTTTYSENVSLEKARMVAENFFTEKLTDQHQEIIFGEEYIKVDNEVTTYFVFNINEGFVIVSSDDAVFPILGYSFTDNYSGNNFPNTFKSWMDQYAEQILFAIEKKQEATATIRNAWQKYSVNSFAPDLDIQSVEPMLQTTWSQGCHYNSLFPIDSAAPCDHLWTGCVATAMGQLMKYYNYPKNGKGSHGYNSSYGWVEADFENTVYDWAGMKNNLNEENNPVAELLYHAAISINSQFFPNGTGAFDFDARDALVDYFDYKSDAQFFWRDSYQGDWKAMLRAELDAGRPLLYGGADSQTSSGHTLVCDGYQDTSFFHFNWGWNGTYNGYFYIDSLVAGNNFFDIQHDAVVGISPDISGAIVTYPPENLLAEVDFKDVSLSWDHSSTQSSLELIGYNIYRNDSLLTESILNDLTFTDSNVPAGSFEYSVQSAFIGEGNGPAVSTEIYISKISKNYSDLFEVYPNPANEFIYIENSMDDIRISNIEIYELSGKKVFSQNVSDIAGETKVIALPDILKGVYLLKINAASFVFTKKLLIDSN